MELSLATPLLSRDGNLGRDPYMLNCYWEANIGGGRTIVRRPALGPQQGGLPAGTVQGVVHAGILHYVIINDTLYQPNVASASIPINPTVGGQRMDSVTNIEKADKTNPSFVKTNFQAWLFISGSFAAVTDTDYPSSTVPGAVYLDGTYYVMNETGQINGSDLENCQSWNALNFITTDHGLGPAVALHRHLNYVVAFCEKGTQFFYDAANPAPGSPLSSIQNATVGIGCAHPDSIQAMDDFTIFLSQEKNRSRSFSIIQGLSIKKISTPDIDRILERYAFGPSRSTYANLYSMLVKADGHTFYIFTLADQNLTLAYDVTNDHWAQWSSYASAPNNQQAWQAAVVMYAYAPGSPLLFPYIIPPGGRYSYSFGQGDQVGSETVVMGVRTRALNAGTTVRKVCSELSLLGDTVAATMNVRYTNDAGNTWSAWRPIDLSTARKRLTRLGTFVSRMYEFQCVTSAKVRLDSFVLPDRNLPAQTQPSGE